MKKAIVLVAFLSLAPLGVASAQDAKGHWETRLVDETTPGRWENRTRKVWQEPWVEIQTKKNDDGTTSQVRVEHPGEWKNVVERVWIAPETHKVEKKVWVADSDYVKPWDDSPKGRTEQPTKVTPSTRTPEPTQPAPRAPQAYPGSTDKVERDPLMGEVFTPSQPAPAPQPQRVIVQQPAPQPAERVVIVQQPAPQPVERVVYVNGCWERPRYYYDDCWAPRRVYVSGYDCWGPSYCGPRVGVAVGVPGVGVGVRIGHHGGVGVGVGVGPIGVGVRVGGHHHR